MKESSPAGTTVPTRKSAEAIARIATISDNTRSYLTLLGKLHDCYGEFVELVERDYGPEQPRLGTFFDSRKICYQLHIGEIGML